jgi:serine/threonine protein kinase
VVDYWEDDQAAIMVSRYLSGGTLLDLITRSQESGEGLPVERILEIATEIAHGLAYIHGRRILYLDLQPRNVLFDERGTVHLVDFDTAVPLDQPDVSHLADRPAIVYMAPELIDGGGADQRADLYSLGATIYEMAAGRPPFAGSREEILTSRRAGPPPPVGRQDLPEALRDLIVCLLSADREQRPAGAAEVLERLGGIRAARADIEKLLASDESAMLEFKSVLRIPVGPPKPGDTRSPEKLDPVLKYPALKSLAAFLNTDGGTLIIGVRDDRSIAGIEADFPDHKGSVRDGWRLAFDDLVSHYLGGEALNCIDLQLEPWQSRTIAIVQCSPSREPVWIGDDLYVRRTASTEKLSTRHAVVAWCRQRWRPSSAKEVLDRLNDIRRRGMDIYAVIAKGEGPQVEFKASMRFPRADDLPPELTEAQREGALRSKYAILEKAVLKTIAAFLNSQGGTLLVGVKDDRTVVGIEDDFGTFGSEVQNVDTWQLNLKQKIINAFGPDVWAILDLKLDVTEQGTVACIDCPSRAQPTWLNSKAGPEFFIRAASSTESLPVDKWSQYIKERWGL